MIRVVLYDCHGCGALVPEHRTIESHVGSLVHARPAEVGEYPTSGGPDLPVYCGPLAPSEGWGRAGEFDGSSCPYYRVQMHGEEYPSWWFDLGGCGACVDEPDCMTSRPRGGWPAEQVARVAWREWFDEGVSATG